MFETFGLYEFLVVWFAALGVVVLILVIKWALDRDKMVVRVLRPIGPRIFLKKPELTGNLVYMEKKNTKKGVPWSVKFTQTYPVRRGLWKTRHDCIDVYPGADSAIVHDYEAQGDKAPTYDRDAANRLFDAGVIKSAGQTGQKVEVPMMLWILVGMTFIISFIGLLASMGIIKLGGFV